MKVAKLVFPHDLSPMCDRALDALSDLEVSPGRVYVVHVLPRVEPTLPELVRGDRDETRRAEALSKLLSRLGGGPWSRAEPHVAVGDPAHQILEFAHRIHADLIALPSHGRSGLGRWMLGSVAEGVSRFASCPVLILPAAMLDEARERTPPAAEPEEFDEQIERTAVQVLDLVAGRPDRLTALTIGLPPGEDAARWEMPLEQRLLDSGIQFVDIAFRPWKGPRVEILMSRFEGGTFS